MKMLHVTAAAVALALAAPAAQAQIPPATIAVINIQQVMNDATAAKSVRDQLEKKQKAFQAELAKKEEALQKEDQELGKKRSVLSKEEFEKQAAAFRAKATEAQKEVQSKKALLDAGFERALGEIQKAVTEIITDLAKEKGFTAAIPTSQMLYADPKLDVSKEVLERLNKKLPKVDVKFDN